jgi:NAD-dependent protein deacetylase/lipoamidase
MDTLIQKAAAILGRSRHTVALTGAGISVESGIPPFRGKGGLWEKFDPMTYAHIDAFEANPAEVWKVLFLHMQHVLEGARPNDGHRGLCELERKGILQAVITQNVDGLHQKAGNRDVIEFHGTFATQRCSRCGRTCASADLALDRLPPRCACGGIWRPDVVMFGELIPFESLQRAQNLAASCDVMLVIGTSATVEPAASLPLIAKHNGARVIEINAEQTPLTNSISDTTLLGKAGETMRRLVAAVEAVPSPAS